MEIDEHLARLRSDGELLATAIEAAGPDASVPTCPEWKVRDLMHHVGGIHRWARVTSRSRGPNESTPGWPTWSGRGPTSRACGVVSRWTRPTRPNTRDRRSRCEVLEFLTAPSPAGLLGAPSGHETAITAWMPRARWGIPRHSTPLSPRTDRRVAVWLRGKTCRDIPTTSEQTMALRAPTPGAHGLCESVPTRRVVQRGRRGRLRHQRARVGSLHAPLNRRGVAAWPSPETAGCCRSGQETIRIRWVE